MSFTILKPKAEVPAGVLMCCCLSQRGVHGVGRDLGELGDVDEPGPPGSGLEAAVCVWLLSQTCPSAPLNLGVCGPSVEDKPRGKSQWRCPFGFAFCFKQKVVGKAL